MISPYWGGAVCVLMVRQIPESQYQELTMTKISNMQIIVFKQLCHTRIASLFW